MKCPHCLVEFHDNPTATNLQSDVDGHWQIQRRTCPACKRYIIHLEQGDWDQKLGFQAWRSYLLWPKGSSRQPCPPEVPTRIAEDYREACLVLSDSPKASAALTRRCLQQILREAAGVKPGRLVDEINEVIDSGRLPTHLSEALHDLRTIGNFAAHPEKSASTGEILPVELGEAEWTLDVVDGLFDFYYVQPAKTAARKAALNAKLEEAGKKTLS